MFYRSNANLMSRGQDFWHENLYDKTGSRDKTPAIVRASVEATENSGSGILNQIFKCKMCCAFVYHLTASPTNLLKSWTD